VIHVYNSKNQMRHATPIVNCVTIVHWTILMVFMDFLATIQFKNRMCINLSSHSTYMQRFNFRCTVLFVLPEIRLSKKALLTITQSASDTPTQLAQSDTAKPQMHRQTIHFSDWVIKPEYTMSKSSSFIYSRTPSLFAVYTAVYYCSILWVNNN